VSEVTECHQTKIAFASQSSHVHIGSFEGIVTLPDLDGRNLQLRAENYKPN